MLTPMEAAACTFALVLLLHVVFLLIHGRGK
jgi:hypothetical protein